MNDLDLCLEVVSRSRQPLRYIGRWVSLKPLEIETSFQRTTNMAYGLWNGHVTDDVTWPPKVLWGSTVGYRSDSLASCILSCFVSLLFIVNALSSCAPDFIQFIMFLLTQGNIQRCISTLLSCVDCGLTGLSKFSVYLSIANKDSFIYSYLTNKVNKYCLLY